jgi:hypothetical protein
MLHSVAFVDFGFEAVKHYENIFKTPSWDVDLKIPFNAV